MDLTDRVLIENYIVLARRHGCSLEKIEKNPELRAQYLAMVRCECDWGEEQIFTRATNLRKDGQLPRSRELARQGT